MVHRFEDFVLDDRRFELRHRGAVVKVRKKALLLLTVLLEACGHAVTKEELLSRVWPRRIVSKVTQTWWVNELRRVLGKDGALIQTVYGYGYRFVGLVESDAEDSGGDVPRRSSTPDEQKTVTVLACIPVLEERPDPHTRPSEAEAPFLTLACEVAARLGGTVVSGDGEGTLLIFGAPLSLEDHASRAAAAGLELCRRAHTDLGREGLPGGVEPALRAAVHTGPLIVSAGVEGRARLKSMNGTLDQAIRLARRAPSGKVLVSETARAALGAGVQTRPFEDGPERIHELACDEHGIRRHGVHALRAGHRLSRFVGREDELAFVMAHWGRARQGRGGAICVAGEAGIGKSRFAFELSHRIAGDGSPVIVGHAASFAGATPFLPVVEMLRERCGVHAADQPAEVAAKAARLCADLGVPAAEVLPVVLGLFGVTAAGGAIGTPLADPQSAKAMAFKVLRDLVFALARSRPALMVLEDLHWVDGATAEWLAWLVPQLAQVPLLVVLTSRPEREAAWLDRLNVTRVTLEPLGPDESESLLREVLAGSDVSSPMLGTLLAQADGNPLFLEELGLGAVESLGASAPLPTTIASIMGSRIDRLPPDAKLLLQMASVIGPQVELDWLELLAEMSEAEMRDGLACLGREQLLHETQGEPGSVWTFKHVLTQRAAYESLAEPERRRLHVRLARILADRFPAVVEARPELLAVHLHRGGLAAEAIPCWKRAAEWAAAHWDHRGMVDLLGKALESVALLPPGSERDDLEIPIRLAHGLALAWLEGVAHPEVEAAFARAGALGLATDAASEREQLFNLALVSTFRGDLRLAGTLLARAATLAEAAGDLVLLARAHALWMLALCPAGAFRDGLLHGDLAAKACAMYGRPVSLIEGWDCLLSVCSFRTGALGALGLLDQGYGESKKLIGQAFASPHEAAIARFTPFWWIWGDPALSLEHHQAAIDLVRGTPSSGVIHALHRFAIPRDWALARLHRDPAHVADLREHIRWLQAAGQKMAMSGYLGTLADACLALGRKQEGLEAVAAALALTREERMFEAEVLRIRGELELLEPDADPGAAETTFRRALDVARELEALAWEVRAAMSLARLWRDQGKRTKARLLLGEVYGRFTEGFSSPVLKEAQALLRSLDESSPVTTTRRRRAAAGRESNRRS